MAAGADFAYPEVEGHKPAGTDLVNRYVDAVQRAATTDQHVCLVLTEVTAMLKRSTALFAPAVLWRVARSNVRRRSGTQPAAATSWVR